VQTTKFIIRNTAPHILLVCYCKDLLALMEGGIERADGVSNPIKQQVCVLRSVATKERDGKSESESEAAQQRTLGIDYG